VDVYDRVAEILRRGRAAVDDGPAEVAPGSSLEELVPGRWLESDSARVYVGEWRVPLEDSHGSQPLRSLRRAAATQWPAVLYAGRRTFPLDDGLFLDAETTGLGRGPGTFCFMVGTGQVTGDELVVRQYMAPHYADEPLLLSVVADVAAGAAGLITFNGRTFDLPVLEARYILNAYRESPLGGLAHLDLLPLARRLWSRRLPSCALAVLEAQVLGVERSSEDIPGYLIPEIYREYVLTGSAESMARVFYHNRLDIISMVAMAGLAGEAFEDGAEGHSRQLVDAVAVGRIREADCTPELAIRSYRAALGRSDEQLQSEARQRLSLALKRSGRLSEAVSLWLDALGDHHLYPYVELAKYYEHVTRDYGQAEMIIKRAMHGLSTGTIQDRSPSVRLRELARRLERIQRRQERVGDRAASCPSPIQRRG